MFQKSKPILFYTKLLSTLSLLLLVGCQSKSPIVSPDYFNPFYEKVEWKSWYEQNSSPDTIFAIRTGIYYGDDYNVILTAFRDKGVWYRMKAYEYYDRIEISENKYYVIGESYFDENMDQFVEEITAEYKGAMSGKHIDIYCKLGNVEYKIPYFLNGGNTINDLVDFKAGMIFNFYSLVNNKY